MVAEEVNDGLPKEALLRVDDEPVSGTSLRSACQDEACAPSSGWGTVGGAEVLHPLFDSRAAEARHCD